MWSDVLQGYSRKDTPIVRSAGKLHSVISCFFVPRDARKQVRSMLSCGVCSAARHVRVFCRKE